MPKLNLLMLNYEFPPIGGGGGNAHLQLLHEYAGNGQLTIDVLTSAPEPGFYKEISPFTKWAYTKRACTFGGRWR